jgi:FrmR/RcnR family transcriptional regulator, repressor of frmRAB operon
MGHVTQKRDKLLLRIRRLRGQLDAAERAIEADDACTAVLQTLVACRGALNGLITEVVEDHVRHHVVDPDKNPRSKQAQATRELIDVLKTYLR